MGRKSENPATSAADDEKPLFTFMGHRRAEFPSGEAAMYKVTIHISTLDQVSKRTERTEVVYFGGV